jgi:hypothetical protein
MKKLLILLVVVACAAGCGTSASQSGVWEHETLYRDMDHLRFSWGGHKDVSSEELQKSAEEGWWGKEIPAVSGK